MSRSLIDYTRRLHHRFTSAPRLLTFETAVYLVHSVRPKAPPTTYIRVRVRGLMFEYLCVALRCVCDLRPPGDVHVDVYVC